MRLLGPDLLIRPLAPSTVLRSSGPQQKSCVLNVMHIKFDMLRALVMKEVPPAVQDLTQEVLPARSTALGRSSDSQDWDSSSEISTGSEDIGAVNARSDTLAVDPGTQLQETGSLDARGGGGERHLGPCSALDKLCFPSCDCMCCMLC